MQTAMRVILCFQHQERSLQEPATDETNGAWQIADAGDNSKSLSAIAALDERLFFVQQNSNAKVREMIGKGTGTGKVISRGLLPPDDPVFKEGWSIHIGSFSGQLSAAPSSTSGEADEPDVMRDAFNGKVIRCPYCKSAKECQHWLAFTNWDFPYEPSGYCAGKFDQFRELTETAFMARLQSGTDRDCQWGDPELNKLWTAAFDDFQYSKSVWMDRVVFASFVLDLFARAGGKKYRGSIENAPGPGLATVWTLYYAKNPATVFDAALAELKKLLTPDAKTSSVKTQQ